MKTVYVLEHAIDGLTENMRLLGVYVMNHINKNRRAMIQQAVRFF